MNIVNIPAQYLFRILVMLVALNISVAARADWFGDEDVLWKSGINLYIKFDKQDRSAGGKTLPNQHPVDLNGPQIATALKSVEFWKKKGYFSKNNEVNTVFSSNQAQLLGTYLAQGLKKAKPGQDIVFALATIKSGGLLKEKYYMAGRAFYQDNRLNIIIGDYDRPPDKGLEAATGATGTTEVQYFFNPGRRAKASDFKKSVIVGDGVDIQKEGTKKPRLDWLVIDVPTAAAAYGARFDKKDKGATGADLEALRAESARLDKERREMRAEMARLRKEMSESSNNDGGTRMTVEERLSELDELHKKKLISDAEYEQKRKEILDDI